MEIKIDYTTQLKAALGKDSELIQLEPGATVRDAVGHLAKMYPTEFGNLVMMDGQPLPSILFSVNDKQVDVGGQLQEGDSLTLLSAISGG